MNDTAMQVFSQIDSTDAAERIVKTLRNIFQSSDNFQIQMSVEAVKPVIPLLELIIKNSNHSIQLNALKIVFYICRNDDRKDLLEIVLNSSAIMKAILQFLQSGKKQFANDSIHIVGSIAAGSVSQCKKLIRLKPSIIDIINHILSSKSTNYAVETIDESYRIIANLCACDEEVLELIFKSNLYHALIRVVEDHHTHTNNLSPREYMTIHKSLQKYNYTNCIMGICYAVSGASDQQIDYILSLNWLTLIKEIMNSVEGPGLDAMVTYEVLKALTTLLTDKLSPIQSATPKDKQSDLAAKMYNKAISELKRKQFYRILNRIILYSDAPALITIAREIKETLDESDVLMVA